MCGDEARRSLTFVYLPDGAYVRPAAIWSPQRTLHFVAWTKPCFLHPGHLVLLSVFTQRSSKSFPRFHPEAELGEEPRFARAVAVGRVEQVVDDLLPLDQGQVGIG